MQWMEMIDALIRHGADTSAMLRASAALADCVVGIDAYTYITRGGVFAGAQTGNVVLLGVDQAAAGWVPSAEVPDSVTVQTHCHEYAVFGNATQRTALASVGIDLLKLPLRVVRSVRRTREIFAAVDDGTSGTRSYFPRSTEHRESRRGLRG